MRLAVNSPNFLPSFNSQSSQCLACTRLLRGQPSLFLLQPSTLDHKYTGTEHHTGRVLHLSMICTRQSQRQRQRQQVSHHSPFNRHILFYRARRHMASLRQALPPPLRALLLEVNLTPTHRARHHRLVNLARHTLSTTPTALQLPAANTRQSSAASTSVHGWSLNPG